MRGEIAARAATKHLAQMKLERAGDNADFATRVAAAEVSAVAAMAEAMAACDLAASNWKEVQEEEKRVEAEKARKLGNTGLKGQAS